MKLNKNEIDITFSSAIRLFIVFLLFGNSFCQNEDIFGLPIARVISECTKMNDSFPCFSEKAAVYMDRTIMDENIPLLSGMSLKRNMEKVNYRQGRNLKGYDRFTNSILNFFRTHVISLDLGDTARGFRYGGMMMGGGKMKGGEKKYMQYAFMVMLGIFGLTGPIAIKVIAVMAAKALIAAKAALIIVGSVALKKLFEREDRKPSIKVHTIEEHPQHQYDEEYDRIGYYGAHGGSRYYHGPYSGYDELYNTPATAMETNKINVSE